jgi:hypothetical protein
LKVVLVGCGDSTGKDTFCGFMLSHLRMKQKQVKAVNFAYKLKMVCFELYGWGGLKRPEFYEEFPSEKNKIIPALSSLFGAEKSARQIWIDIAKKCREYDDNVFINSTFDNSELDWLIVRDFRYPNEYDQAKKRFTDVTTVEVLREGFGQFKYGLTDFKFDITVHNDGDRKRLNELAIRTIAEIQSKLVLTEGNNWLLKR